jgi:DNA replication protein DnaC
LQWQREVQGRAQRFAGTIHDDCRLDRVIPERYRAARIEQLPTPIQQAAETLPEDMGLFLWGPPGVGKTHSLCAIARQLYFDGYNVDRLTWDMLCLKVRDTFGQGHSELKIVEDLVRVDKLVVEDVGVTVSIGNQESDFSLRILLLILDQRLEQCRATFITSNKSIEELGRSFDARIASRLQQACKILKLEGADRRKAQQRGK